MHSELPLAAESASNCQCCTAGTEPAPTAEVVLDPVCGMSVVPAQARATVTLSDTTYYFCAPGCASAFGADPKRYLAAADSN